MTVGSEDVAAAAAAAGSEAVAGNNTDANVTPEAESSGDTKPAEAAPPAEQVKPESEAESAKPENDQDSLLTKKADVVPEKYEEFNLPEGLQANEEALVSFQEAAKAANLSQEKAQSMVDLGAKLVEDAFASQAKIWTEQRETWVNETKKSPDFEQDLVRAQRTLKEFGTPGLNNFLSESGFGDHPELFKLLANIDKKTGEDVIVDGGTVDTKEDSVENILYPNHKKK